MNTQSPNNAFPQFPFPLPLILDGATGTELIRSGMPSGVCPEQWILEHPDIMESIQERYASAGSNAILAPTFGANRIVLSRYHLEDRTTEMNRCLVAISRRVADRHGILVGGDLSPTGKLLSPVGDATFEELVAVYAEQIKVLDPFVDFYLCETNMDLATARAAVVAAKEAGSKPIFVTLTVTESGRTMSGDTPEAALFALSELGISAFGLNCSTGPREMSNLIAPLIPISASLGIPLIAKPNAGAPCADGKYDDKAEDAFETAAKKMMENGILILGGCCGTNAGHVAILRKLADSLHLSFAVDKMDLSSIAANARSTVSIPIHEMPSPIFPDDDLIENAEEMAEENGFLFIQVNNIQDVENILESAMFLTVPIAVCGDPAAISLLKRRFCGKIVEI